MKRGVLLQSRLSSSRLPEKALLRLSGMPVVSRCMHALCGVHADARVLVTDAESEPTFAPYASTFGFDLFVGSPEDVLDRYVSAAREYRIDTIVRATGDNPLVSAFLANRLLDEHETVRADYSGYLGMPLGTGVEIIQTSALEIAHQRAVDRYDREHVSPFLYKHPVDFRIHRPSVEAGIRCDAKVTLDTSDDYHFLQRIFDEIATDDPIEIDVLVNWLRHCAVLRTA